MQSGGAQLYPVDEYMVSVSIALAGICAVSEAYRDFRYGRQVHTAIEKAAESDCPPSP